MHLAGLNLLSHRAARVVLPCLALASLALFGVPAGAADGAQLATDYGCINCHSGKAGSAPSVQQLAERLAKEGDRPEALQAVLKEMRSQTSISSHRSVPDEPALAILKWLAQGAK